MEIEITEQEVEGVISWVSSMMKDDDNDNEETAAGEIPISTEERKLLVHFAMSLQFDQGRIDLIEKYSYTIRFFQKDLRVDV